MQTLFKTTPLVEKYELKIAVVMREIAKIQRDLLKKQGLRDFSKNDPRKLRYSAQSLKKAHNCLHDAIGFLVAAGNPKKSEINMKELFND